ncbi:DUF2971 domain-containing protein [Halomonas sp. hl-4]|uniref:DUF2971 domain-containing protein n=1 Tax=Halomonas sp. hl-4 TaxID=1761789 RepID=UPI000BB68664|nr:DUF2971 domain-containing protein [Halomonas sp. hl-4]SNY98246.1 Protein of unknown function [Halomonas sp. hl-4]
MLKTNNYINIDLNVKDQYIYRIISIERLIELFSNKKNVLVSPRKWEDPFENFILKSKARLSDGEIADFGFRDDFYGQCWTRHKASDAMWRIYSPESSGVRIRTTIPKLANSLAVGLQPWQNVQCFIGKVKYLNNKRMMDFANTVFKGKINPEAYELAKTLLIKRPAFKHENEVRLLYFEKENGKSGSIYEYDIDPHSLIDQIMIDPRLDCSEFRKVKADIQSKTNFKGRILRSLLYAPPENMVFPFGL